MGVAVTALAVGGPAQAVTSCASAGDICTITQDNATVEVDPDAGTGLYTFTWKVDGTDHLFDQSFWFRIDGDTRESPVAGLTLLGAETTGAGTIACGGGGSADCSFAALYDGGDFEILVSYTLQGGTAGSGTADLVEQIKITNTGSTTLNIDFFEYNNFDLDGTVDDLSVQITGAGEGNTAIQRGQLSVIGEVIVGNTANITGSEVAIFSSLIDQLLDASVDDFDGTGAPKSLAGLADYEFGFQWTFAIAPGLNEILSKDKLLAVPEPGTLGLFGMGLLGLGFLLRRRKRPA